MSHQQRLRRNLLLTLAPITMVMVASGCASTKLTKIERQDSSDLARPERVVVHDVATTIEELPDDSLLRPLVEQGSQKPSAADLELGHALGAQIAQELVERLIALGLPAERAAAGKPADRIHDLVIRGGFVKIEEGNKTTRVLIGFGAGSNELKTHFELYKVTASGHTPIGTGEITAEGSQTPGMLLSMGIAGLVRGAAIGGAAAAGKEFTSESIQGAAKRTADKFIETVEPGLRRRGWIEKK